MKLTVAFSVKVVNAVNIRNTFYFILAFHFMLQISMSAALSYMIVVKVVPTLSPVTSVNVMKDSFLQKMESVVSVSRSKYAHDAFWDCKCYKLRDSW